MKKANIQLWRLPILCLNQVYINKNQAGENIMNPWAQCRSIKTILYIVLLTFAPNIFAENPVGIGKEKYNVSIGYFLPAIDTELRADSATLGRGTVINLEDDLGLEEDQNTGIINATMRLGQRHRLGLGYFRLNRSATGLINRTIQFEDQVFAVNTLVSTTFNNDIIFFNYMYSIFQKKNAELALALGFHYMNTDTTLSASGGSISSSTDAAAPLPVIGVEYKYAVSPKLHLGLLAQWFEADAGDYDGSIRNLNASIEYFVQKNVSLGLGYNNFNVNVDVSGDNFNGALDWTYKGIQAFTSIRF
jgi:hypothetical protein